MSQCTCTKDKEATCIVHPTTRSMKEYIAELEAENKALRKLLEVAACPADCCEGSIPRLVGYDEWEADQCQFCYERAALQEKEDE